MSDFSPPSEASNDRRTRRPNPSTPHPPVRTAPYPTRPRGNQQGNQPRLGNPNVGGLVRPQNNRSLHPRFGATLPSGPASQLVSPRQHGDQSYASISGSLSYAWDEQIAPDMGFGVHSRNQPRAGGSTSQVEVRHPSWTEREQIRQDYRRSRLKYNNEYGRATPVILRGMNGEDHAFQSVCVQRLPVTVVHPRGLLWLDTKPIELPPGKTIRQLVSPLGRINLRRYAELIVKQRRFGVEPKMNTVHVLDDDFPYEDIDIYFGQPFLETNPDFEENSPATSVFDGNAVPQKPLYVGSNITGSQGPGKSAPLSWANATHIQAAPGASGSSGSVSLDAWVDVAIIDLRLNRSGLARECGDRFVLLER
ncbi:hypothetical protein B0T26DRAFT_407447 [Lasiosphaeria miniovina]|uniref:Uncharacterized protein n=1 Tax=Lasiosphaeria miniovina TaxID=1954250 RepID=A0AA40DNA7_9PEZI|nr:uncharacterized protein B0T26DRAFT_407447 [Lasiosphaeria miniovina]KAK0709475.1 hypothetical protein B0T26DRAFT_407447 [Lasiosphaeria miniovina]